MERDLITHNFNFSSVVGEAWAAVLSCLLAGTSVYAIKVVSSRPKTWPEITHI